MKIRGGFVSNSSSSSFILEHNDNIKVLSEMIKVSSREYKRDAKNLSLFKKSKYLKMFKNNEIGVMFVTINYNTYIFYSKKLEAVIVETCNNTDWRESEYFCDWAKYIPEDDEFEKIYKSEIKDILFYNLNCKKLLSYEFIGEEVGITKKCKSCGYSYTMHKQDDKLICGICFKEIKD